MSLKNDDFVLKNSQLFCNSRYGIEDQLMTLLCWGFTWFRFMTGHTTAAACFTYVLHLAMTHYRESAGIANLAKKTLVDARFLT